MQDLNLSDFSNQLREKLHDEGINLPKSVVLQLTKAFFKHVEKTAEGGTDRFTLWNRDITHIYPIFDEKALCTELAEGKDVLTIERLIRRKRMQPRVFKYLKKMGITANVNLG